MSVTSTAGIAAAWSAAKAAPPAQPSPLSPKEAKAALERERPEPTKGPPPAEGQGTRIDTRA